MFMPVEITNSPSDSRRFIDAFLKYIEVDQAVLMLDKLRDAVMYASFMLASAREEKRVVDVLDLGL